MPCSSMHHARLQREVRYLTRRLLEKFDRTSRKQIGVLPKFCQHPELLKQRQETFQNFVESYLQFLLIDLQRLQLHMTLHA